MIFLPDINFDAKYINGKLNKIGKGINIADGSAPFEIPINIERRGKQKTKINKLEISNKDSLISLQ